MGVSQNWGYHFRGPNNQDYSVLGSILGSPYFGKLPYIFPDWFHKDHIYILMLLYILVYCSIS